MNVYYRWDESFVAQQILKTEWLFNQESLYESTEVKMTFEQKCQYSAVHFLYSENVLLTSYTVLGMVSVEWVYVNAKNYIFNFKCFYFDYGFSGDLKNKNYFRI